MKITGIETFTVGAGWKNWLFVRVDTDAGIHGVGEGTLNGFIATTEAGVHELRHLAIGEDPRRITALAKRMLDSVSLDGGHIHRTVIAAVEVACWDILGKSLGVPVHQLLGGRVRDSVLGYANGWYRTERTPEAFLEAARAVIDKGFHAFKVDPFGTAQGFISREELELSYAIMPGAPRRPAARHPHPDRRPRPLHRDRRDPGGAPLRRPRHLLVGGADQRATGRRPCTRSAAAARSRSRPARCTTPSASSTRSPKAAASTSSSPSRCRSAASARRCRWRHLAAAHGSWIAPHQSGGPVATAVCLQLAAAVPNFLIQEHFDAFNDPWTRELVTWQPADRPRDRPSLAAGRSGPRHRPRHRGDRGAPLRPEGLPQRPRRRLGDASRPSRAGGRTHERAKRSPDRRSRRRRWLSSAPCRRPRAARGAG